ncbi:MAG: hypothetical protein IT479_05960 [Xanthomonadales bacterium]|nr:hypothetical protein [Xanthomonadales bacterium]MCC6592803.1 hypothetical protein [Xanthomonadales bacterium]MCE7931694.1 hypothetical protein [Xanthomonadales bacterium PRO6]
MKKSVLSISLLLASFCATTPPVHAADAPAVRASAVVATDPAQQLREVTQMLRANDLAGLVRQMMSAEEFQRLRQEYELERSRPISDEERAEFEQKIARFVAPDAVDRLMEEIEPKLAEARPQAAGAIMMAIGGLQMALASPETELTEEQRTMLRQALPGIQAWITSTDFLSSQTARQALTYVTDAARASGIGNLDQLRMLSLEEVLAHGGRMFAAGKRALQLYGLDFDAIAASARYETVSVEGDRARVRATITVFDAPLSGELELRLVDGRWIGKDAHIKIRHDDEVEESSES